MKHLLRAYEALTVAVLFLLAPHMVHGAKCGNTVLKEDFSDYPSKKYQYVNNKARARKLFPMGEFVESGIAGVDRLQVGEGRAKVSIRKGCASASSEAWDDRSCGIRLMWRLPEGLEEATLTYKVKFSHGYNWTKGGKLPGLGSEQNPASCKKGGYSKSEGWSNRVMWREGGKMVGYSYLPLKPRPPSCGVDLRNGKVVKAKPGQFKEIRLYIKLNTPDKSNGKQELWYDGKKVFSKHNFKYRYYSRHKIQRFVFHVYHGGKADDKDFQARKDQTIWFDNFRIRRGRCPPAKKSALETFTAEIRDTLMDGMHSLQDFMGGLVLGEDTHDLEARDGYNTTAAAGATPMTLRESDAEQALDELLHDAAEGVQVDYYDDDIVDFAMRGAVRVS